MLHTSNYCSVTIHIQNNFVVFVHQRCFLRSFWPYHRREANLLVQRSSHPGRVYTSILVFVATKSTLLLLDGYQAVIATQAPRACSILKQRQAICNFFTNNPSHFRAPYSPIRLKQTCWQSWHNCVLFQRFGGNAQRECGLYNPTKIYIIDQTMPKTMMRVTIEV